MTLLRNMLTVVGILAIIGIALFYIRGDFYNSFFAKPSAPPAPAPTGKVYAILSASQGTLIPDNSATPEGAADVKVSELIEAQNTGFPPRSIPYLAVVNTGKKEIRYWKLSKNVRQVRLRTMPTFDIKLSQAPNPPGAPYQVEIWVPREENLSLEFDLGPAGPSQS